MASVELLALGGTISMVIRDGLAVPTLKAGDLAEIAGGVDVATDVALIGGSEVDFSLLTELVHRVRAAEEAGRDAVIITVGTDAIEETASWLTYAGPWSLSIVVTGSQLPGGEDGTDAVANLRDAVAVARHASVREPVVVFAGDIVLGRCAVKVSGTQLRAFGSPGQPVVGGIERDGSVRIDHRPPLATTLGQPGSQIHDVPLVIAALGSSVCSADAVAGAPAVVFAANGAGNLPPAFAAAAGELLARGTLVALATRAADATVAPAYGYPGGSGLLHRAGAVLAPGMTPHRLRAFLMLALSRDLLGPELRKALIDHLESLKWPWH